MQENKELYQRENGEWALYPYLITCTDKGVREQKFTDDVAHYEAFRMLYPAFVINSVQEMKYTPDQLARLAEVQGLEYKHYDEIYDYVMHGNLRIDSKVFAVKIAEQNRADIDYLSIMTEVEL